VLEIRVSKKMPGLTIDLTLSCQKGELFVILGPSGAGKSTILRMIAGLEQPDKGRIAFNSNVWTDTEQGIFVRPQARRCGLLFQDYPLFPHLTVKKNVLFKANSKKEGDRLLKVLGIQHISERLPKDISGGERQRAALAQVLAKGPRLLLLDEPFSALDMANRVNVVKVIAEFKGSGIPIILVTHDVKGIETLTDEVAYMEQGHLKPFRGKMEPLQTGVNPLPKALLAAP